jgi:SAM-dependent methyltransferase
MPVFLDLPTSTILEPQLQVAGWVASAVAEVPVSVAINGRKTSYLHYDRPDVTAAFGNFPFVSGISASVSLFSLPVAETVEVEIVLGEERAQKIFTVARNVVESWYQDAQLRLAHQKFCTANLRCPACGAAANRLQRQATSMVCTSCRQTFAQTHNAINMISEQLAIDSNIAPTALISANPYTPAVLALINRITGAGGMVLDCGAGARPSRMKNVINAEIVDYASTDILSVGESLPFADATFDAVVSLAVLEHVRDPFKCAAEILRVLKPGGELIADVPLLQPVHGYPHHYYNMTMQGLRNLFADNTVEISREVPPHGHPIFAIQWILRDYLAGLPADLRPQFAAMTAGDLINLDVAAFLGNPLSGISLETRETIACLNSLHVRKR